MSAKLRLAEEAVFACLIVERQRPEFTATQSALTTDQSYNRLLKFYYQNQDALQPPRVEPTDDTRYSIVSLPDVLPYLPKSTVFDYLRLYERAPDYRVLKVSDISHQEANMSKGLVGDDNGFVVPMNPCSIKRKRIDRPRLENDPVNGDQAPDWDIHGEYFDGDSDDDDEDSRASKKPYTAYPCILGDTIGIPPNADGGNNNGGPPQPGNRPGFNVAPGQLINYDVDGRIARSRRIRDSSNWVLARSRVQVALLDERGQRVRFKDRITIENNPAFDAWRTPNIEMALQPELTSLNARYPPNGVNSETLTALRQSIPDYDTYLEYWDAVPLAEKVIDINLAKCVLIANMSNVRDYSQSTVAELSEYLNTLLKRRVDQYTLRRSQYNARAAEQANANDNANQAAAAEANAIAQAEQEAVARQNAAARRQVNESRRASRNQSPPPPIAAVADAGADAPQQ